MNIRLAAKTSCRISSDRPAEIGSVMDQRNLFIEDPDDALRECARSMGGLQRTGSVLRPELDPITAGRWLGDCLNPSKREKLDLRQILLILREARKVGCHAAMNYIARDAGYAQPRPVEPEDEAAELQRTFLAGVEQQRQIAARLEQLFQGRPANKP